jgi:DNA-binding HxlR family transcriptional regulator
MAALNLLGRRWALRILWRLRAAGLVERTDEGCPLTRHGRQLGEALTPQDEWSRRWARALR